MATYVDANYTNSNSRTFIGRGSEAGVILLTLLNEDPDANLFDNYIATDSPKSFQDIVIDLNENGSVPENMLNKKLHYSFSSSNNQASCHSLVSSFQEANYSWLDFTEVFYGSNDYENTYRTSYAEGLEFVFGE